MSGDACKWLQVREAVAQTFADEADPEFVEVFATLTWMKQLAPLEFELCVALLNEQPQGLSAAVLGKVRDAIIGRPAQPAAKLKPQVSDSTAVSAPAAAAATATPACDLHAFVRSVREGDRIGYAVVWSDPEIPAICGSVDAMEYLACDSFAVQKALSWVIASENFRTRRLTVHLVPIARAGVALLMKADGNSALQNACASMSLTFAEYNHATDLPDWRYDFSVRAFDYATREAQ